MRCGVCDKPVRKGKGRRVFVAASSAGLGGIRRVVACVGCADKCILLSLDTAPARCECGRVAVTCSQCEADRAPKVRSAIVGGAIKRITGLMKAYPKGNAFHAGLQIAFDVLTSGDWEEMKP
jgi:hypothetical protein